MTLREWMDSNNRTEQWVASMLGEPVAEVRGWVSGRVTPSAVQRQLVASLTKGEVQWKDSVAQIARGSRP